MEDIKIATLKGEVRGYTGNKYGPETVTRSISPANVYLKIYIKYNANEKSKKHVGDVFDPYSENDMNKLYKEHPVIYTDLIEHKIFEAHPVNEAGEFEIKAPIGEDWAYIICARVEQTTFEQQDENGNTKYIGIEEATKSDYTIDDIIIPVKDKWWSVTKGKKSGDPTTDPSKVPPGVVDDAKIPVIEEKIRKGEY